MYFVAQSLCEHILVCSEDWWVFQSLSTNFYQFFIQIGVNLKLNQSVVAKPVEACYFFSFQTRNFMAVANASMRLQKYLYFLWSLKQFENQQNKFWKINAKYFGKHVKTHDISHCSDIRHKKKSIFKLDYANISSKLSAQLKKKWIGNQGICRMYFYCSCNSITFSAIRQ